MRTTLRLQEVAITVPGRGRFRVSLEVAANELVAAVADPDVGTALARVVAGLAAPTSGHVHVGKREVTHEPPGRRQIGYVPAGGSLLPHLTIRENIEYGDRRRPGGRKVSSDWVTTLAKQLQLRPTLDLRPHQVSDAQRLRAAVARAAAARDEALVVDFPAGTGGADRIGELIARATLPLAPGMAVLVCTRVPAVLARIPQQVSVAPAPADEVAQ